MTFIKITNIKGEVGLINSDHLQTVDTIDGKVRFYFIGNVTITISLEEYVRIEPLLLSDMPAAEPVAAHDGTVLLRLLDTWQDAKSRAWNGATIDYAREKKQELLDYIQTQYGLPTALITAYREYQRMLSLTGISQHRIDMQRAILIDLLGVNMPLEETPNAD